MRTLIRVWPGAPGVHGLDVVKIREGLLDRLRSTCGAKRVKRGSGSVNIFPAEPDDLVRIKTASDAVGGGYQLVMEDHFTKTEIVRMRFIALPIEGEDVDRDSDRRVLNCFPKLLCPECRMPDETVLPDPFLISTEMMLWRGGYFTGDERCALNREIFPAHLGVVIVADRVKRLMEQAAPGQVVFGRTQLVGKKRVRRGPFWAMRPTQMWGSRQGYKTVGTCSTCGNPLKVMVDHSFPDPYCGTRIETEDDQVPEADIVASRYWVGNRASPFSFGRDILVSGRLHGFLLQSEVVGLIDTPLSTVSIAGQIPMRDLKECRPWIKQRLNTGTVDGTGPK